MLGIEWWTGPSVLALGLGQQELGWWVTWATHLEHSLAGSRWVNDWVERIINIFLTWGYLEIVS